MATSGDNRGHSLAAKTKFIDFCKVCDKIESKRAKNDKKSVIKKFIDWWRQKSETDPEIDDNSFYPALRLLCPHKDIKTFDESTATDDNHNTSQSSAGDHWTGRAAYGMKIDKLRQKYTKILSLSKESDDAKRLANFNRSDNNHKDFATVLYEIMTRRSRVIDGTLTLRQINDDLDRIGRAYEESRVADAEHVLTQLINHMTALENKWLVRIVLKDMSLGIGDTAIMNTYHSDAGEYYDTIHNLSRVCRDLSDPTVPLSVKCIQLFAPFSPMLSERVKLKTINRLIDNKRFFLELKYDGQRFQIHKRGDQYKYFSRNCNDFSDDFNDTLTPFLSNAFDESVVECILDGEMMAYETSTDRVLNQTEKGFDVKRIASTDTDRHPLYVPFDVLYLNGEVLTAKPLSERVEILQRIVKPVVSRLSLPERRLCETKEEIIETMNAAIDRQDEGIIVKLCDSVYRLNVRQGGGWLKLKPDYIDGLMDELDLLIIGGSYGARGGISHFFVALKATDDDSPTSFVSLCRVGTGYSNEELRKLQTRLEDHWRPYDRKKSPQCLQLGRLKPEVWIDPKNSVVLQVKAAEVLESDGDYGTHYTLRFPRVMKIRDDKDWHECMSVADMDQMRARGSLANSTLDVNADNEPEQKRRRVMDRPTISRANQLADVSDVVVRSDVFAGKELCFAPFKDTSLKHSLERRVVECGAKVVANPARDKTFCIIADNCDTIAVKRYMKGVYDVVKYSWIQRCAEEGRLLDYTPSDMWCQTEETSRAIADKYDKYGDSYTEPIFESELKELFEKMSDLTTEKRLTGKEMADIEYEFWPNDREMSFLRTVTAFVDNDESSDGLVVKYTESIVRFYGATVVHSFDDNPSHVVVISPQRSDYFKQINRKNTKKFRIVSQKWVQKCIEAKDALDFVDL